jgi:hypothetical protein
LTYELDELGDLGVLGIKTPQGTVVRSIGTFGGGPLSRHQFDAFELLPTGQLLYDLIMLKDMPRADKLAVLGALDRPV